jgi:multicomponent Na+:H+ antiporter subunit E
MSARRWLMPAAALGGLWWLLSGGSAGSWLVGLPAIALALWLGREARGGQGGIKGGGLSVVGLVRFLPFFLVESVRGGLDVAARTLVPHMRIAPGLGSYRTRLNGGAARLLFANCVSLLPGTLSAELDGDVLQLHLLDARQSPEAELRRLESVVAQVFNENLIDEREPV